MKTQFSQDLRLARKRAGLLQADIAHLMGIHHTRYSLIERGHSTPRVSEFVALSIILDRQFTSYCLEEIEAQKDKVFQRLETLPEPRRKHPTLHGRTLTLARLRRLEADKYKPL